MINFLFFVYSFLLITFQNNETDQPFMVVLGIAQDAGYPQIDCKKDCCKKYWDKKIKKQKVVNLGLFDPASKQKWIFEATPDLPGQLHEAEILLHGNLSGIFLTHAQIGHYTGLMYLGREAMNAIQIPVYTMPRMQNFLENNGPWNQLVSLKNIKLQKLKKDSTIWLTKNIAVTPLLVPHRDEFSETVAYSIKVNKKTVLFIPDIDKWQKWEKDIRELVKISDYLFLDATFFNEKELPGRNMTEIPHPFVKESMELFKDLPDSERSKIWFIHFNHTNPLIDTNSPAFKEVKNKGFNVATEGQEIRF